jgi:hypothetical protein
MIIYGVLWLKFDSFVVALDGLFIVFDFIIASAEVSMISWDFWFEFNSPLGQLYFFMVLLHLS